MNTLKRNKKTKKIRLWLLIVLALIVVLPIAFLLYFKLECDLPLISMDINSPYIGPSKDYSAQITDQGCGLKKVWIRILQNKKESVLLTKEFPAGGLLGAGAHRKFDFTIHIDPSALGISDGKAVLGVSVRDNSWRNWFHGNLTYLEKDLVIDTKPPIIDVLTRRHNISQGGSGLVIYKVSEQGSDTGVHVGENYFPGYNGYFKDNSIYMAFIALDHLQGLDTSIFITAMDKAGNKASAGINYHILKKRFKKDTIIISDGFLRRKMPDFDLSGDGGAGLSGIEKFLFINQKLRKTNTLTLTGLGRETQAKIFWKGAFLRLPRSATRAGFSDHRTYKYHGRTIDHEYHMGVDLASISHAKVPAANNGRVVFTGKVGIYGRTVVIDHGFGLFSTYSHLSRIDVEKGRMVSKGEYIGISGMTGMAGGDHLHFGMFVNNTFVNPVEWWDGSWIKNNIQDKIDETGQGM